MKKAVFAKKHFFAGAFAFATILVCGIMLDWNGFATKSSALTSGDFSYTTLTSTTCQITGFSSISSTIYNLEIPSTINGYTVVTIGASAFEKKTTLTSVTIPSTVTTVSSYAFNGCTNLVSVTIPSSVTSIGNYAFNNCSSLTGIDLKEGLKTIGT